MLRTPEAIRGYLARILCGTDVSAAADHCVGSLTTLERDEWADIRRELVEDPTNRQTLDTVEDALFVLCLDDFYVRSVDYHRQMINTLCGDDGRNRWFDKSFQLIVDRNGTATINYEHSWGDGLAIGRLLELTYKDSIKHRFVSPDTLNSSVGSESVRKLGKRPRRLVVGSNETLEWHLTESLRAKILEARAKHNDICRGIDFGVLDYAAMNSNFIKARRLSPDSVLQLALQMAYYKAYNEFTPTYEAASTAAFLRGRLECLRRCVSSTAKKLCT